MKPQIGYIYELDGQVVVNPEKEPELDIYDDSPECEQIHTEWLNNCILVVNAEKAGYRNIWFVYLDELYRLTNGQKVEHIEGKITKIL